jgi:hypothetical protein
LLRLVNLLHLAVSDFDQRLQSVRHRFHLLSLSQHLFGQRQRFDICIVGQGGAKALDHL